MTPPLTGRPSRRHAPVAASLAVSLAVLLAVAASGCRATPTATTERPPASATPATPTEPASPSPAPAAEPSPTAMPVAANDPAGLAAQLTDAETAIRDTATPAGELARLAHLQQTAYRRLARHPEWRADVLASVPEHLRGAVRANTEAVADLVAMITPLPAGSRPSWRIVAPAPAGELLGYYREAERASGIGWQYLAAIHLVETRLGRIRGTSVAGAQGPMQFMPGTWARYGQGDVQDNRDAILAAGRYLKAMGGPANMDRALRRYNNSARYVRAIQGHAAVLRVEPHAFRGYYHWQVHYLTQEGDLLLPEGYPDKPALAPA